MDDFWKIEPSAAPDGVWSILETPETADAVGSFSNARKNLFIETLPHVF
jgi:hypothetical protein